MSEKNPPFTPIQTRFVENLYGNSHDQTVSRENPARQEHVATHYLVNEEGQVAQLERNIEGNIYVEEQKNPNFGMGKPRLKWTPVLNERFNLAVLELGGFFKATPKAVLQKMNVKGVTIIQTKSHLQKVRNQVRKALNTIQIPNAQAYDVPNSGSSMGENQPLHQSNEIRNCHRIAPTDEGHAVNNMKSDV
ncbi:hypothetical protein DCAR_0415086 [Daucus carota subsp. sativus]|uniref:HTH myb-type domain-containing protein n=2 Tax=Daucus carota subsp. sativus TaxID=79200 RepID=A0A165A6P2_DAUCS|nr:hypothetical protein DCAR_0415086 [Daucus carota subsp. sativus]